MILAFLVNSPVLGTDFRNVSLLHFFWLTVFKPSAENERHSDPLADNFLRKIVKFSQCGFSGV